MMLNMYLALRGSLELFAGGDCKRALGVIEMMQPSIEGWQAEYSDPDIDADWELLLKLEENLQRACRSPIAEPPRTSQMSCFFI